MKREELLRVFSGVRTDEVVVTTMGAVRAWGRLSSRPELDFVSADSAMGHAADLALGIALAKPERRVLCFNGDGSMLMCLGTLATIVSTRAPNLILVVLQNGVYEITGGQTVPGIQQIKLADMARAAGFQSVFEWSNTQQAALEVPSLWEAGGPCFVLAHIEPENDGPIQRGPNVSEPFLQESIASSAHELRKTLDGSN